MSTLVTNSPIPVQDRIVRLKDKKRYKPDETDPLEGRITPTWIDYFSQQAQVIAQGSTRINSVALSDEDATIAATDITSGSVSAGLYRMTYFAQITQAATSSSSLEVTFDFTSFGQSLTKTFAAVTGNTVADWDSGSVLMNVDGAPIRYSTTYASSGATVMQYYLYVLLEQIQT